MFRVVRTAALLAVLACFLALPAVASAKPAKLRMQERVNTFRANHGVKPVRFSSSLAGSAKRYARRMMSSDHFGHSSRIHASGRWRSLGEVIEYHPGRRTRLRSAFRSWKNSASHRSILLSSNFRQAGAGFTTGRYRGGKATMWVMHFGRR